MRLFELLTLIFLLVSVVSGLWPRRPRWNYFVPLVALVTIGLHLLIEGYRWQMVPAYGLAVWLAGVAIWRLVRPSTYTHRWLTAVPLTILGLVVWGVALALPTLLPVPSLGEPSGPFPVGTTIRYLVDENREEIYSADPSDNRELIVQLWYPAGDISEAEQADYLPNLDQIGPVVAEDFGLPAFLFAHVNLTELAIYRDAPVANGRFPVILFSHGLGGLRTQNTIMMQELASHGFVVGAVGHTYANAITVFPDGRAIVYEEAAVFDSGEANPVEGNQLVTVWAEDMGFLLDQMALWDEGDALFNGRFDLDGVGVFGHSTGGGATLQFCLTDPRCAAGIGLDSWVLPATPELRAQGPTQPFMFISTPRWLGEENQAEGKSIFNNLVNDGYELTLDGTGHYDFTDLVLLSPLTPQLGLSGEIDSQYALVIQNEYVLAFFLQYVAGQPQPLLERPSAYPELTINRN